MEGRAIGSKSGGGGEQVLDWETVEANTGEVKSGESQSDGDTRCDTIQQAMEKLLEKHKMMATKS